MRMRDAKKLKEQKVFLRRWDKIGTKLLAYIFPVQICDGWTVEFQICEIYLVLYPFKFEISHCVNIHGACRCRPDVHSYTTLLAAYANSGNMKKAEQLLKRMKQAGLEPNVVTYGTLMLGYTSVHDTSALLRTFEELQKAGIKPNTTIFTLLIRTFGQQENFDSAMAWFKMMVDSGCSADQRSRAALMDACQTNEQKQEVLEYFGTLP